MINEPIKITDLESLNREKKRLEMYCSFQEDLISEKWHYIKNNPQELFGEMVLPKESEENKTIGGILDFVNENLLGKVIDLSGNNKLYGAIIKAAELGVVRLLGKFMKKS